MVVDTDNMEFFGDLAEVLRALKEKGWTGPSVRYVVNRVFWEDDEQ